MSRKRSASKTDAQPEVVFFVDRSLGGRKVVEALRNAGARVEAHADHFPPEALDEDWITFAGSKGWVVLTKDSLRSRPIELRAVAATGTRTFILTRRHLTGDEMARILVGHLQRMIRLCRSEHGPFVATIGGKGLRLVKRAKDLR